jgi:hypothetical protein
MSIELTYRETSSAVVDLRRVRPNPAHASNPMQPKTAMMPKNWRVFRFMRYHFLILFDLDRHEKMDGRFSARWPNSRPSAIKRHDTVRKNIFSF